MKKLVKVVAAVGMSSIMMFGVFGFISTQGSAVSQGKQTEIAYEKTSPSKIDTKGTQSYALGSLSVSTYGDIIVFPLTQITK